MIDLTQQPLTEAQFYLAVAKLLGCETTYAPWPYAVRNRWNHRYPGNGRYINHGMVRRYSATMIHVALHTPALSAVYDSDAQALAAIRQALQSTKPAVAAR